jgi:hypothetical protein
MGLLRRKRGKPKSEAAAGEDRSEEEAEVREVGPPDPSKVTQGRAPNGQWTTLKRM